VASGRDSGCAWESAYQSISLLYAPGTTYTTWETATNDGTIGHAETMSVWIQGDEVPVD